MLAVLGVMWLLRSPDSRVCVSFILPGKCQELILNGQLAEKERCQGQCDPSLLASVLVVHPARGCHCRKACSFMGFGFYLGGSPATSGQRLREHLAFLQ